MPCRELGRGWAVSERVTSHSLRAELKSVDVVASLQAVLDVCRRGKKDEMEWVEKEGRDGVGFTCANHLQVAGARVARSHMTAKCHVKPRIASPVRLT